MVSVYVKAAIITVVLFASNFLLVKYFDDTRNQQLQSDIASIEDEVQSANTLMLYSQVFNNSADQCPLLRLEAGKQQNRLYQVFSSLQSASKDDIFSDTTSMKRRFIVSNIQLWLYIEQLQRYCGGSEVSPVIYFYNAQGECSSCAVQAQVLEAVVNECPNVRVFALPSTSDIQTVSAIKERFGVESIPSLIINDMVYPGLQSSETIINATGCTNRTE